MEAIGMMFLVLFFVIFEVYAVAAILVVVGVIGLLLRIPKDKITRRQARTVLVIVSLLLLISMI